MKNTSKYYKSAVGLMLVVVVLLGWSLVAQTQTILQSPSIPNNTYLGGVDTSNIARALIGMNSSNKVSIDPAARGAIVNGALNITGTLTAAGAVNFTNSTQTFNGVPHIAVVASDFSTSGSGTNAESITGLSYTLPATAMNVAVHCGLTYEQTTGNAAVTFGVGFTAAPTNAQFSGLMETNTTTVGATGGTAITSATTGTVVTGTPAATSTNMFVTFEGYIQNPATANTVTFLARTATAADIVVVRQGSYCTLLF